MFKHPWALIRDTTVNIIINYIYKTSNTHLVNFCSKIRANNFHISGNWSEPYVVGEYNNLRWELFSHCYAIMVELVVSQINSII